MKENIKPVENAMSLISKLEVKTYNYKDEYASMNLPKGNQYGLYEDREEAMLKVQYSHLKRRHTKNNMVGVVIDYERFKKLSKSKCKYCGAEYSKVIEDRLNESKSQKRLSEEILKINGIDRLDSSIGYTNENSVTCCKTCNFAKNTLSESEFYSWIKKIYEYNFK